MSLLERVRITRPTRSPEVDPEGWVQAVGSGLLAAAGSWLVLVLPALLVWVATSHTTVGWGDALGIASAVWFLGLGSALSVGLSSISLVPLGIWAVALTVGHHPKAGPAARSHRGRSQGHDVARSAAAPPPARLRRRVWRAGCGRLAAHPGRPGPARPARRPRRPDGAGARSPGLPAQEACGRRGVSRRRRVARPGPALGRPVPRTPASGGRPR